MYVSKNKSIENSLTFEEFLEFTKIGHCHYCGNPITWNSYRHKQKGYNGYNLDRKDNGGGYAKDNCVVCCEVCNYMKRTMTAEAFIQHCKDIVTHQQKMVAVT
jgi:phage-related protein